MSSPAKRRKKNDGGAQPVRNLDFFFKKQKAAATNGAAKEPSKTEPVEKDISNGAPDRFLQETLMDEELARRLQEEWNEDAGADAADSNNHQDQNQEPQSAPKSIAETAISLPHQDLKSSISTKPPEPRTQTLSLQSTAIDEDTITTTIPFDISPLQFNPQGYVPALRTHWAKDGGLATYALLTRCFVLVNSTQSRIKIVDTLVNLLRTIIEGDPDSLLRAVWLATNSISPPYISLELGLGGSAISKALKKTCGLDNAGLKTLYNKYGDPGDVAFEAKKRQTFTLRKPKPLTIKGVFDSLVKIANSKGTGSQEVKQRIVERLVQDARGAEESRYIVRTLVQHLRIGAVKTTMLIALSRAFLLSRPPNAEFPIHTTTELSKLKKDDLATLYSRAEDTVKASFARRPNYNDLIPTLLEIGVCEELLVRCGLGLHIPLRPMLGSITRDLGEMLDRLKGREFACEFKYDGQRAQVHCDAQGKVSIFSRHLELMTDKYPDLVALVPQIRGEGVSSFILEGEVVAVDRDSGELKPFQTLANRARKDVAIGSVKIDVCLFAFDLMYLNGAELLDRPFRERRELLRSLFTEIPHTFTWVKSLDATSEDAGNVSDFFKQATAIKCEGIMVKVLDNPLELEENGNEDKTPSPPTPKKPKNRKTSTNARSTGEDGTNGEGPSKKGSRRRPLPSTYTPDKRVDSWLKVKKDYDSAAADTLDLIPIGGWHGQGRKAKWWSPILMAVRNPETGGLEAVTKCMSGFTDAFYKANREKYDFPGEEEDDDDEKDGDGEKNGAKDDKPQLGLLRKPEYVTSPITPSIWFEPSEVWEMAFADITLSPTYTAALGLVNEERGLSLRFPRFLKAREDKSIDEASTSDFLAELYRKQEAKTPKAEPIEDGGAGLSIIEK